MTPDPAGTLLKLYEAETGNVLDDAAGSRLFDAPMVAVADATDAWFARLKEVIGPHHWTPREILSLVAPGAEARSVICWSLPLTETIRASNRGETRVPSRAWALARHRADAIFLHLATGMETWLRGLGYAAVAPTRAAKDIVGHLTASAPSACWSQRHVAFVAGLGTFGISGGLITVRGVAHRLGSVVTDAVLSATIRPYGDDPFAWCLKSARGTCGTCIRRCPVGSIGESVRERDIDACRGQRDVVRAHAPERYDWTSNHYGCGLCQTAVPCEDCNPTANGKDA